MRRVVLVGAGHAHVEVLRRFAQRPLPPDVVLTLLTRAPRWIYSGMVHGVVAGTWTRAEASVDVEALAAAAGAGVIVDEAIGLDLANRQVRCKVGDPLPFHLLCLDIGAGPATLEAPSLAIPVRPIDEFLARFEGVRATLAVGRHEARLALVGGGAAGVELLLAAESRLRADAMRAGHAADSLQFTLLTASDTILSGFPSSCQRGLSAALAGRGIAVRTGVRVTGYDGALLHVADGAPEPADAVLWATEARPAAWLAATGLRLDAAGFLRVDAHLRASGHLDVFAAGDTASFDPHPLPKAGVYAVRAGPVLAHNIRATLLGAPLRRFRPQAHVLSLLSTSDGRAFGTRNGVTVSGRWVRWWKDRIDRRFLALYKQPFPGPQPKADR